MSETPKPGVEVPVTVNSADMVQYIVENGLTEVPPEFILPPRLRPSSTRLDVRTTLQIPLIDMSADDATVVEQIGRACEDWGFFQVNLM